MADDEDKRWLHPTMGSPEHDRLVAEQDREAAVERAPAEHVLVDFDPASGHLRSCRAHEYAGLTVLCGCARAALGLAERAVDALQRQAARRGVDDDLLTDDEHECVRLLGQASALMTRIVAEGPTRAADIAELYGHVHVLQRTIGSQAAARAFPARYRLLGSTLRPEARQPAQEPSERPFMVPAAGDVAAMDDHAGCYLPDAYERTELYGGSERLVWPCGTYAEIEPDVRRLEYSPDMLLGMHDANRSLIRMVRLDVDRDEHGEALPLVDESGELRTGYVLAGDEDRDADWLARQRDAADIREADSEARWAEFMAATQDDSLFEKHGLNAVETTTRWDGGMRTWAPGRPDAVRRIVEGDPTNIPGVIPQPAEPTVDLLDHTPVWDREAIATVVLLIIVIVGLLLAAWFA